MRVRDRVSDDADHLGALLTLTRDLDGYPPHWPPDSAAFVAPRQELRSFVAESANRVVVGHVALHQYSARSVMNLASGALGLDASDLAVIASLVVDPSHRRLGVGRELLEAATAHAHELGRQPVLDVVTHFDEAIRLYESCGWRRLGDVTIEFRSPCSEHCSHQGNAIQSYVYVGPAAAC